MNVSVGTFKTTERMRENVMKVLETGRLSYGPFCRTLESCIASMHDSRYGVMCNSGTDALRIALATLKELHKWDDGDEVIVPAVTFVATVNIVLQNNLKPVLVDVEPTWYGINPEKVAETSQALTKLKAIIPVHLFGMPCNMQDVVDTLPSDVMVIEDSCECMLATHMNQSCGSIGDIGCFSTYVAHLLTTGVGGIAITNDAGYAAKMRSLVNHGRDGIYISIDDDNQLNQEVIRRRFSFESIGYSSRATELEAAIGCAQLSDLPDQIITRQQNAQYLTVGLKKLEDFLQLPSTRPRTSHSYMMYPIVLREGNKWDLCNYLEKNGIETREMLRLTDQPCYKGLWKPDDYPVAKWLNEQGFYIGCHQDLDIEDLNYVINTFLEYFNGR